MAKAAKQRSGFDLVKAQQSATAWVRNHIENTPLGLPEEMTEADFGKVMDAIVKATMAAYAAGYMAGRET